MNAQFFTTFHYILGFDIDFDIEQCCYTVVPH
jgi:hypothetical protein